MWFFFRMSYLELHNAPITMTSLLDTACRHYRLQLVQQFYVLVLGLNILGNPYSYIGDFSKGLKNYYEPLMVRNIVYFSINYKNFQFHSMEILINKVVCTLVGTGRMLTFPQIFVVISSYIADHTKNF